MSYDKYKKHILDENIGKYQAFDGIAEYPFDCRGSWDFTQSLRKVKNTLSIGDIIAIRNNEETIIARLVFANRKMAVVPDPFGFDLVENFYFEFDLKVVDNEAVSSFRADGTFSVDAGAFSNILEREYKIAIIGNLPVDKFPVECGEYLSVNTANPNIHLSIGEVKCRIPNIVLVDRGGTKGYVSYYHDFEKIKHVNFPDPEDYLLNSTKLTFGGNGTDITFITTFKNINLLRTIHAHDGYYDGTRFVMDLRFYPNLRNLLFSIQRMNLNYSSYYELVESELGRQSYILKQLSNTE